MYKIIGLLRVRNEEFLIKDTLDHLASFCTGGVFVYDDCSTDATVWLCEKHPIVKYIIRGTEFDLLRESAKFENRTAVLKKAKEFASDDDWFVYVDADERLEFDWETIAQFPPEVIGIKMKLFDYYITEEDVNTKYDEREWLGPEFRSILLAFKNLPALSYHNLDKQEVELGSKGIILNKGYVKHYGKALTVDLWERKCDYYISSFPAYSEKWKERKGKAIHKSYSDFGNKLIKWNDKDLKGVDLMFVSDQELEEVDYEIDKCEICGHENFIPLKTKPTTEWDGVKKFYSDNGIKNTPFLRIPEFFNLVQCSNCKVVFVNPRLKDKVVNKFYDEYFLNKFTGYLGNYDPDFREQIFIDLFNLFITTNPNAKSILDIGCAKGSLLKVARKNGLQTFGIEVSAEAASEAKLWADIKVGDVVEKLKEYNTGFDIISMIDVLEHLKDPKSVLDLVSSKLNMNGMIYIEVPNVAAEFDEMTRHFYLYSKESMRYLLESCGFSSVKFVDSQNLRYNQEDSSPSNRFLHVVAFKDQQAEASKLSVLITNHHLLDFTGSEIYTLTLADYLHKSGHSVTVYSKFVDMLQLAFDKIGVRLVTDLGCIKNETFDIAHIHHQTSAYEVRYFFPQLPMVFLSHGVIPFLEQPPQINLNISKYVAVSEEVRDNLIKKVNSSINVEIARNIIDDSKFVLHSPINKELKKALILSNKIDKETEEIILEACRELNVSFEFIGMRFKEISQEELPTHINNADIVFTLGRGVIETMFCGRIPFVLDCDGGDGFVTPINFTELMNRNFSGRTYNKKYNKEELVEELRKYKAENAIQLRKLALEYYSPESIINKLEKIYKDAIEDFSTQKNVTTLDYSLIDSIYNMIFQTRIYTERKTLRDVKISAPSVDRVDARNDSLINTNVSQNRCKVKKINMKAFMELFQIHIKQQNYLDASLILQKVIKNNPYYQPARDEQQNLNMVIQNKIKEKAWNAKKSASTLIKAENYIASQNLEKAKILLYEILNYEPEHIEALNDLSVVSILMNKLDYAEDLIEFVLTLDPQNEIARGNLEYLNAIIFPKNIKLDIYKLSSLEDYELYTNSMKEILKEREEYEMNILEDNDFYVNGYCHACKSEHEFLVEFKYGSVKDGRKIPNWRESLFCTNTYFNARMRSTLHFLREFVAPNKEADIYISEQVTGFYDKLKTEYPNLVGSEFLGNTLPWGAFNDKGIRNEDITRLSFSNESFDVILSFDVFEHVPNYKNALKECYRVLRHNGQLMFTIPFSVKSENTIARATLDEKGSIQHILSPQYHGDPLNEKGILCFNQFGWDIITTLKGIGFDDAYACTFWSKEYGYLGNDHRIFIAKKC